MYVNVDGSLNFLFCDKGQSYSCGRVYARINAGHHTNQIILSSKKNRNNQKPKHLSLKTCLQKGAFS